MQRADQLSIAAGTPGFKLMLSAGQAVAEAANALVEEGPILIVAGPGNNGGDGFVAAAELAAQGRDVSVILMCERDQLQGDAASAARGWKHPVLPFNPQAIGKPALIIDALFGAGLSRPVDGEAHAMIEAINANGAPVLAVDLPSGINGTSAAVMGAAVNATETVTFFRKKPAHLLLPGRMHCGHVRVADIGIDAQVLDEIAPRTFENDPDFWGTAFPVPRIDGHKYARGHVLAVSGDAAATGAARLAARGALRAGAGLVTLATPRDALAINASALTAVMVRACDTAVEFSALLGDKRYNTCLIGPGAGVGDRTCDLVHTALHAQRHLVLDADAADELCRKPRAAV
ncbi:hydroxyethylthiazole kinase-like uncharacterized protein yjeF [Bradyrhizobium sp. S3.14.4]